MRRLDGVRQPFDSVGRIRVEEQRTTAIEGQLKGDRDPLRPRVFEGGETVRQIPYLPMTATNRRGIERRLCRSAGHRKTGILDGFIEGAGDPAPNALPPQVVGPESVSRRDRGTNAGAKLRVEPRGLHEGNQAREEQVRGPILGSPCE